jgi:two-component system nitrate/nitrite response regulator NarL
VTVIKLLVVDDHPILRQGVAEILRQTGPGAEVLQARNAEEGLELAVQNPGLAAVILDLNLPDSSGMEAIAKFAKFAPVMILSASEDPRDMRKALAHGAMGYVTKSVGPATLTSALQVVLSGNICLPPLLASVSAPERATIDGRAVLTGRQMEVLEAMDRGLTNKDIGLKLDLSEKTVKTHITAIFRALNVVNRTQAINAAREASLLPS